MTDSRDVKLVAGPDPNNSAKPQERSEPKFQVGQIVVMRSIKKELPFRIVARVYEIGEWCYAWNRKNYAAEHMLRELNDLEKGVTPTP